MNKKMLIDTSHKEETRVVVLNGNYLDDYDVESATKKQIKGNIYLAKIIRIEPSLQAAFVDYGGNRHGFLAFSEIHPDYYQIPVADRQELLALQDYQKADKNESNDSYSDIENYNDISQESPLRNEERNASSQLVSQFLRRYKIQEVIHRRQILLVQVVKEERGNKGAALTTYLSLAGRYCVLMPNSLRAGGISRKITLPAERRRLREIIDELDLPAHMGLIIRTAGAQCPKADTLRDGEYLLRLWDEIRESTMQSIAPTLIYEDSSLIKRAIRDLYTSDINEILVDGEEGWGQARDFMRTLMPQNVRKLQLWRDRKQPLFANYHIENLLDQMLSPIVQLKSGGYLVINQTEALVAIDVNSGRSIKERGLEETALRTNQEAAEEIARQLRLRDLAGLIVIDFIDMESKKHNYLVERRLKTMLHRDRARIQVGSISMFGLLEMTRQRLRSSITEFASVPCPHCNGTGMIRSIASSALRILRLISEEARKAKPGKLTVYTLSELALYILNQKRSWLANIEKQQKIHITFVIDETLQSPQVKIEHTEDKLSELEYAELNEEEKVETETLPQSHVREIPIQTNEEENSTSFTEEKEILARRRHNRRVRNHSYQESQKEEPVSPIPTSQEIFTENFSLTQEDELPSYLLTDQEGKTEQRKNIPHKSNHYNRISQWKRNKVKNFSPIEILTTEVTESVMPNKDETATETSSISSPFRTTEDHGLLENSTSRIQPMEISPLPTAQFFVSEEEQIPSVPILSSDLSTEGLSTPKSKTVKKTRQNKTSQITEKKTVSKAVKKTVSKTKMASKKVQKALESESVESNEQLVTTPKNTKISTARRQKRAVTNGPKATKQTTRHQKKENEAVVAPIVIDENSPAPKPRIGWWKR